MTPLASTLLWNVSLAAVLAATVGLAGRTAVLRRRPGLTHALWLLVLAKLVTPPLISLPIIPQRGADDSASLATVSSALLQQTPLAAFEGAEASPTIAAARDRSSALASIPPYAVLMGFSGCGTMLLAA